MLKNVKKNKKSTTTRQKILKNAYDLFKEKGYLETTTREIAERADIKHGLIYYYYKKKEDIFVELCMQEISIIFKDVIEGLKTDDVRLITLTCLKTVLERIVENEKIIRIYTGALETYEMRHKIVEAVFRLSVDMLDKYEIIYEKDLLRKCVFATIGIQSMVMVGFLKGDLDISYEDLLDIIIYSTLSPIKLSKEEIEQIRLNNKD